MFLGAKGAVLKRGRAGDFSITEYTVSSGNLPKEFDGFRIVQISDLHSACFGDNNILLADAVKSLNADLIAFSGDMFTIYLKDFASFFGLLENLNGKEKKVMVLGNHEQRLCDNDLEYFCFKAREYGVSVLRNEREYIEKDGEKILVAGLELPLSYYRRSYQLSVKKETLTKDKLNGFIGEKDENEFTVLAAHNPLYFDAYAQWGAELTLSGHVHGGIVEIPKLGGILSPERTFFPKYCSGLYTKDKSSMVVSRGMCCGQPLVRVFNPRELVTIVLKSNRQ